MSRKIEPTAHVHMDSTRTLTLTDFLLARIAEDEANIDGDWAGGDGGLHIISSPMHDRMVAECEAKRDIVREHVGYGGTCGTCGVRKPETGERWPCRTLRLLGWPYADHPDYDEAWRP